MIRVDRPQAFTAEERIAVIPEFAEETVFKALRREVLSNLSAERVHIPTHKRGATVAYGKVREFCPYVARFYESSALAGAVSQIVGQAVGRTPARDQSSCSILIYNRPGDRIGWHYDHNFYNGPHFTALLALVNENRRTGGLSSARLMVQRDGRVCIPTPCNTLVVFEGAAVRHCVTAQGPDEVRIVLSMTFCADPGTTSWKDVQRRFKDIAYIGVRALWT